MTQLFEDREVMGMRIKQLALAGVTSVLVLFCGGSDALACRTTKKFDVRNLGVAEVVFRGRVESYEEIPEKSVAKLGFVVDESYRGPREISSWSAFWHNSVFGRPGDFSEFTDSHGTEFIVGLVNVDSSARGDAPYYMGKDSPKLRNLPWILQEPCSPPFMFAIHEGHVTWVLQGDERQRALVEEALRERKMLE